jgi:hypothetical protein
MHHLPEQEVKDRILRLRGSEKKVLRQLWTEYALLLGSSPPAAADPTCAMLHTAIKYPTTATAREQAAMSRTIARLELDGMILRQNQHLRKDGGLETAWRTQPRDPRGTRTTHLSFTILGHAVAQALVSRSSADAEPFGTSAAAPADSAACSKASLQAGA